MGVIIDHNNSIYKHPIEIYNFIERMDHEVNMMNKYQSRILQKGPQITELHNRIKHLKNWTPN